MHSVMTAGLSAQGAQGVSTASQRHQMPLSFLKSGETATIAKVRGKGEVHHHLENLGFVEGARVEVLSEQCGSLIVQIKGAQVALNQQVASRIVTC